MRQMHMLLASGVVVLIAATSATAVYAHDAPSNTIAQSGGLTDTLAGATPTPRGAAAATAVPTSTATSAAGKPTPAISITLTLPISVAAALSNTLAATATTALTDTAALTDAISANAAPAPEGVVAGTVIANRSEAVVRFFAEGNTYDLAALRSTGLALSRPSNVINLYNCDAALGVEQLGCYWDPYLLERDGFYEIVAGKDAGALKSLILRAAGTPPDNQVWIQNRAGRDEEVYFGTQMRDLPEGALELFSVDTGGVAVFYLRSCVTTADGASVCEWASHSAQPGGYYALVDQSRPSGVQGTTISNLDLQAVLGSAVAATDGAAATATVAETPQTVCKLAVPALNVRSGPGLGFDIVKKVRSTEAEFATIVVTGRTSSSDWLRVDETIAPGGWVIAGNEYLTCDGDVNALPAVAESELPATPTPLPVAETPAQDVAPADPALPVDTTSPDVAPDVAPGAVVTSTQVVTDSATPALPIGTGLLVVHNVFDRDIRFTLDQRYRLVPGASEFDLMPGGSTSIIVYGGAVPFTASSPWQGLSGNTAINLAEGEIRDVYLTFFYDEVDEKWYLAPIEGEIGKT